MNAPNSRLRTGLGFLLGSALVALPAAPAWSEASASLCAAPDQASAVQDLYAKPPSPPSFLAAPKLGMPEAVVLSALGAERAVGVPGSEFAKVWDSLQAWQEARTLVLKAGHVFEIEGRIHPGKPSTKSSFFNLEYGPGLGGHLRPDLISSIYTLELQGQEGPIRGVIFLDAKGDNAFGVFVPADPGGPPSKAIPQFEATRELMKKLPRACG
jgi:putative heme iron utilization protein